MGKTNKSFRIRTNVNEDSVVNVNFDQTFDKLEILSLSLDQTNAYRLMESHTGIVTGRVLANGGFGVPNAKISVFIEYDGEDDMKQKVLYHYSSVQDRNDDNIRYNVLPSESDDECHQNVGTFPTKRILLDNQDWIDVFDKYYKYTTKTNNAGDYMIYGVPTGMQKIHMDVDLSDIGLLSQTPRDMIYKGYNANLFDSPTKFKKDTNLSSLVQIMSQDNTVYVYPFWGDTTDTTTNAAITRCDINLDYKFEPTCVFMGSVITDTGENSMSKKCIAAKNQGKMSDMVTGEGKIEMIRKTYDGKVEQYSVNGDKVINGDGVWCYQIPMNLDYITTDEFGNIVLSDNPAKGIPTRTRVRFRLSMSESPSDGIARKRAKYLIPNNPRLVEEDCPNFYETKLVDYEFGSKTRDENFRDLMWNNVYTVKNYIPRLQKSRLPNNLKHLGIKMVNHSNSNNPTPFNNLRIKFNFSYMFMCTMAKIIITIVRFINTALTGMSAGFLNLAAFCIRISNLGGIAEKIGRAFAELHGKTPGNWAADTHNATIRSKYDDDYHGNTPKSTALPTAYYMLDLICKGYADKNLKVWTFNTDVNFDIDGLAAFFLVFVYNIGCGITLSGMCTTEDGEDLSTTPGTNDQIKKAFSETTNCNKVCDDDVAKLYNCIENQLAQENEITSFNFYNDWLNGVVYLPLWYRRIKPKRKFLWLTLKAKDQYCANDNTLKPRGNYKKNLKLYNTMVPKRTVVNNSNSMGYLNPLPDDEPTARAYANDETGSETIDFPGGHKEVNCYGYNCHKYARTYQHVQTGVVYEKETMLGDRVQYYKPVYYDNTQNKDTITLFATDLILLGSLNSCDLHGVPQFFKGLTSTTYNMPPDLMVEDFEYKTELSDATNVDDVDSTQINNNTKITEFTGADWGNLGYDQSNYSNTVLTNPFNGTQYTVDANENKYDNGGLFYGLTCFDSYTKPKSCINLTRICEFGVSLDETQQILKSSSVTSSLTENELNNAYETLTPDGFVSYDEIYDMDYRSMFATLNGNFLKTKLNFNTGLTEYDFNHLYVDNFDGSMSLLMKAKTVNGTTEKSNFSEKANYIGNYNLEKSSDAYLNFRYGNYTKMDMHKIYFYEYNKKVGNSGTFSIFGTDIYGGNRQPRYENSFYFYFGLNEGKTAIDKFNTEFFSDCITESEAEPAYNIQFTANSWCPSGSLDGCVLFDCNMDTPITVTLIDRNNPEQTYSINNINKTKFYIGVKQTASSSRYTRAIVHDDLANIDFNPGECIPNGDYDIKIMDGMGNVYNDSIEFKPEPLSYTLDVHSFSCKNGELDEMFSVQTENGDIDWAATFRAIGTYGKIQEQDIYHYMGYPKFERSICGYIAVKDVSVNNFILTIEPVNTAFFTYTEDGTTTTLYSGAFIIVSNGQVVCGCDDSSTTCYGYIGNLSGTYYFGVPYGEQKYKVSVTQFCDDVEVPEDCSMPETTGNTVTRTVTVSEGAFKMFINGIDYDLIRNFKTGWNENRVSDMSSPSSTFTEGNMYGWNDMGNIGYYNSGTIFTPVKTPLSTISYVTSTSVILKVGEFLRDDYDGNGAHYYPYHRGTTSPGFVDDYSTPYSWCGEYCYNTEQWTEDKNLISEPITCIFTYDDGTTTSYTLNRSVSINPDTEGYEYIINYYSNGTQMLIATEDEYGTITFEIVNGGTYSDFSGATFYEYRRVVDNINEIINNRIEFSNEMKGTFRNNNGEKRLTITYKSNETPIKYQIVGTLETTINPNPGSGGVPVGIANSDKPMTNYYVAPYGDTNPFILDSTYMEENELVFTLPTLTYDSDNSTYKPYEKPENYRKHPYYAAIQDNNLSTIPAKSTTTTATSMFTIVVDNFGSNKNNPFVSKMFGIHFYNKPMYTETKIIWHPIENMPKYNLNTQADVEDVNIDGFICGYCYNGVPGVTPTLTLGDIELTTCLKSESDDCDTNILTKRLIYSDSGLYGNYQLDSNYDKLVQYVNIGITNGDMIMSDGYGEDYSLTIDTDNAIKFDGTTLLSSHYTDDDSNDDYIQFSLKNGGGAVYYIYRYTGSNHVLDSISYNNDTGYYFNTMPSLCVDTPTGYVAKTSASKYNIGALVGGTQHNDDKFFILAISGSHRMISPVFDLKMPRTIANYYAGPKSAHSNVEIKNSIYLTERIDNSKYGTQQPDADFYNLFYLSKYQFDLAITTYNNETGGYDSVYNVIINPNDIEPVNIIVEDWYNDGNNNEVWFSYNARAIKITFDDVDIEEWHHPFATDVVGIGKACSKESHCYVQEV